MGDGRIGVTGGAPALSIQLGGMGKIVLLGPTGDPAGSWAVAGDPGTRPISSVRELRCANDHVLAASQNMSVNRKGSTMLLELSVFDEFDLAGKLLRRVLVAAPGDRRNDVLIVMENGFFALLRGFKEVGESGLDESVKTEVVLLAAAG